MIKQPLKQYIEKHLEYKPNSNGDPRRRWDRLETYYLSRHLIKNDHRGTYKFYLIHTNLFNRYMNNKRWIWK